MFCQVALLTPPYSTLTYVLPSYLSMEVWEIGMRVAIPLGNGTFRVGIILEISDNSPNMPENVVLRPVVWPMERTSLLSFNYLAMIKQLALRQLSTEGRILGNVLPAGLKTTKNIKLRKFHASDKPIFYKLRELNSLDLETKNALGLDYLEQKAEVLALAEDSAKTERIVLTASPPWNIRANANKQRELLDFLMHHGDLSRAKLKQKLPHCVDVISSLVQKKMLKIQLDDNVEEERIENFLPPPMPQFTLNSTQEEIFQKLSRHINSGKSTAETALLYGITGSGKTALYLELAKYCLAQNKSVFLLAPEIAIALKLCQDAKERNLQSILYYGNQSPKYKEQVFRQVAKSKDSCLIIGTRSALFLPINNLGLIILDEEHDDSFKQDEGLTYQAKEIAWYLAQKHQALFLIGSATPDIKSFYSSKLESQQEENKPFLRHEMKNRIGSANLPEIELIDFKDCSQSFAPQSVLALKECINQGNQAIIMLNRRGYAPLLYCLDCKTVIRCPHCDIAMSYHKKRSQMLCHYCGYTKVFPCTCPNCKGLNFLPMGEGTERLEEDIYNLLSHEEKLKAKILRMDRDSTRQIGKMEEILSAFAAKEAQILVGTQMLSKGHHFPDVTLVLIADADLGLNFPDYRAVERVFQLLTQAAGRAGRGEKKGKVLIQTRDVNHYCWDLIKKGDYEAFYAHELKLREKYQYPPFVKLALVRASLPKDAEQSLVRWKNFVNEMKSDAKSLGVQIKGPTSAPLAILQGRLRFHCLIKSNNWNSIRQIYAKHLPSENTLKKLDLRIQLDMDPVNML